MKIVFAGTPEFAVPTLQMLLASEHEVCAAYTQPDRPAGRGRKLQPPPVKVLAETAGIPVYQPLSLKNADDFQQLKDLQADLMVVVAYGMILPQTVIDLFPFGCINVHGSLLPRWRGAAPIQRAIMAGDTKTGVTIMKIALKLDAGDMLLKEEYAITPQDTSSSVHDQLSQLGPIGLAKVLQLLENGTAISEVQDEAQVTYAEKLDKSEALLDWSQTAEQLDRKVRGLNAWPVAQTLCQGQVLRIWQAEPIAGNAQQPAGTVVCADKHFDVAAGNGWLRLLEVQLPGGKRISSQAFLNSHAIDGITLG
ncbi:methionyl-tRNA formyltransferase [Methylosoma difficile]